MVGPRNYEGYAGGPRRDHTRGPYAERLEVGGHTRARKIQEFDGDCVTALNVEIMLWFCKLGGEGRERLGASGSACELLGASGSFWELLGASKSFW